MRKARMTAAALLLAGAAMLPALSQAGVAVDINVGPPVAVVETPPPPAPDYVWAPGYWYWEGGRHVWMRGHYLPPNPGHAWMADHWEHRGDHWHYEPGRWR